MKKRFIEFLIFFSTVLIMGVLGGIYSLIFAGLAGGTAISLAPEFSFHLLERYVCPEGAHLQYKTGQSAASGQPDNPYAIDCVAQDGTIIQGMESRAISAVFGMNFFICFIPTYIPGAILLWIVLHKSYARFFDESLAPPDDEEGDGR